MDKDKFTEEQQKIIQLYDQDMTVSQNVEKIANIICKPAQTIWKKKWKKLDKKAINIIRNLIEKQPGIKLIEIQDELKDHGIYTSKATISKKRNIIR